MRLFVALNLPAAERERVHAGTAPLRRAGLPVRWLDADAYHLTLRFLGEVAEAAVKGVAQAVADVAARQPRFTVSLAGAGAFPSAGRPNVWWLGAAAGDVLPALVRALDAALAPLGFAPEGRPYTPHLTLGRTRREAGRIGNAAELLGRVAVTSRFTVETLDLMRSHLSPRGARYERLLAAELAS